MKTEIFYSTKDSLNFGLKEIKQQLDNSFKEFDFLIFSFHPKYDYNDIIYFVNRIFKTDRWVGFHGINADIKDILEKIEENSDSIIQEILNKVDLIMYTNKKKRKGML